MSNKKQKWGISQKEYEQIKGLAYLTYVKSFEGIEFDDLLQEGLLAYAIAKTKYDPKKNDYFMGFAYKRIKGRMLDWVGKQALNGRASVRSAEGDPLDEDLYRKQYLPDDEDFIDEIVYQQKEFVADNNFDDVEKLEYIEQIKFYIDNFMTDFEFYVLYKYFIETTPLIYLSKELNLSKIRVKGIINLHSYYMREFLENKTIKGIKYEELINKG